MERFLRGVAYLEARLTEDLTVEEIAATAGYSVFHYCRIFHVLTGDTVMGHVRARRLTLAAERLAAGDPVRLIELAMDAGFDSQAAFTRAFKRQFGVTPGKARGWPLECFPRKRPPIDPSTLPLLVESLTMKPKIVEHGDIVIAGLAQPFHTDDGVDGPALWRRFRGVADQLPNQVGGHYFGVSEVVDLATGRFCYSVAIEMSEACEVPEPFFTKTLSGGRFAVFTCRLATTDIAAELKRSYRYIYGTWRESSGMKLRDYYDFEYYDDRFDRVALTGEVDIWLPVA